MGFYLKGGRLMNLNTLCREDTNAKNLDLGLPYINNFIFIPAEQSAKLERARALLSSHRPSVLFDSKHSDSTTASA